MMEKTLAKLTAAIEKLMLTCVRLRNENNALRNSELALRQEIELLRRKLTTKRKGKANT